MGLLELGLPERAGDRCLIRPVLLIEAARRRARMRPGALEKAQSAVSREERRDAEAILEAKRRSRAPGYRPSKHVDALARVLHDLGEAQGEECRGGATAPAS